MEIEEVPIGQPNKKKKIKAKHVRKAQEFLLEYEINLEQLSKEQQECVIKYIKGIITVKFYIIILVLSAVIWITLGIWGGKLFYEIPNMMEFDYMTITDDDGEEQYIKIPEGYVDYIKGYGLMCSIFSGVMVITIYSAASAFAVAMSVIIDVRFKRKFLSAIVPALRCQVEEHSRYSK